MVRPICIALACAASVSSASASPRIIASSIDPPLVPEDAFAYTLDRVTIAPNTDRVVYPVRYQVGAFDSPQISAVHEWRSDGTYRELYRSDQVVMIEGVERTLSTFVTHHVTDDGIVLLSAAVDPPGGSPEPELWFVRLDPDGSFSVVARQGADAPGVEGEFRGLSVLATADDGSVILRAEVATAPLPAESRAALYASRPGSPLELIAAEGQEAPGVDGVHQRVNTSLARINADGGYLFSSQIDPNGPDQGAFVLYEGFVGSPPVPLIVSSPTPLVEGEITGFAGYDRNASGDIVYYLNRRAFFNGQPFSTLDVALQPEGGSPIVIASFGESVQGAPVDSTISRFFDPVINERGQVIIPSASMAPASTTATTAPTSWLPSTTRRRALSSARASTSLQTGAAAPSSQRSSRPHSTIAA